MAAYVIADIRVNDPIAYQQYGKQVGAVIEKYGGSFLVRGGRVETLEGDWSPRRIVLLKFPDMGSALREYSSPEYQRLAALRRRASSGRVIVVEGVY